MRKRRWFLIACFSAGLALLTIIIFRGSSEPTYEGKELSHWVKTWEDAHTGSATKHHALEAMVALGTNNLDLLVRRVSFEPGRSIVLRLAWRLPSALRRRAVTDPLVERVVHKAQLQHEALDAFYAMGPLGSPAVPQLGKVIQSRGDSDGALMALNALGGIGEPAFPAIVSISSNGTHHIRIQALYLFQNHTNSPLAQFALTNALHDPNPEVRRAALNILTGNVFE